MKEAIQARPRAAFVAVAVTVFVLACAFVTGGFARGGHYGDVALYAHDATAVVHGQVPYRDFTFEYPPGALAAVLPPAVSTAHYTELFRVLMTLCGVAAILLTAALLAGRTTAATAGVLAAAAAAPLALGPIVLAEYDLWPAALTLGALAALVSGRDRLGSALLGLGAATKVFPAAILPAALVWIYRRSGRRAALVSLAWFVAAAAVLYLAFAAVAPGGVWFSVHLQLRRGLQKESIGAAVLFVLDQFGLYKAHIVEGNPQWTELTGRAGDALATLGTVCQAAVALGVGYVTARRRPEPRTLLVAAAAAVTGFVAFGKVFSPQYLIWLVPLVPLAGGLLDVAVLAAALVLTQLWFRGVITPFDLGSDVWLFVARDALVLALLGSLLVRLRRLELAAPLRAPRTTPREPGRARAGPT
jgi:uncharacterized membrane protein